MTDEELRALEEREKRLRESSERLEKGVKIAQKINELERKNAKIEDSFFSKTHFEEGAKRRKQITEYLNAQKTDAGIIRRFIEAPLDILNPIDAIHQANQLHNATITAYAKKLATAQAKNMRDNLATLATGKDYMGQRKYYRDILNQAGMKNDALTPEFVKKTSWLPNTPTLLGLAGDIGSNPGNAIPLKPVTGLIGKAGKAFADIASKSPRIAKGIDALQSQFNLFHEIEKTMPAADVAEFKKAFQEFASTRSLKVFDKWNLGIKALKGDPTASLAKIEADNLKLSKDVMASLQAELASLKPRHNAAKRKEMANEISSLKSELKITEANAKAIEQMQKKGSQTFSADELATLFKGYKDKANELVGKIDFLADARKALAPSAIKKELAKKMSVIQKDIVKYENNLKFAKIIDEALNPSAPTSKVGQFLDNSLGRGIDMTSGAFKRLMSLSPIFQTRNFTSAMVQGISEGSTLSSYANAAKLLWTKGAKDKTTYDALERGGALSQPGIFERPMAEWWGKMANWGESLNRTALVLSDVSKGKGLQDAIARSMHVFYNYSPAVLTKFEKLIMKRIDPFYSFDKGQIKYFPKALAKLKNFYLGLAKTKEATAPESERKNRDLIPEYRKNQFSFGSYGNVGFQAEDFLRFASLDWKSIYSKTAPLAKLATEGALDYNVFSGKRISTDNRAGQYANLPPIFRAVLGYDKDNNTVDPWMKWLLNTSAGPMMKPVLNAFDPKKDLSSVFTSFREYDTSENNMARIDALKKKYDNGGILQNSRLSAWFGSDGSQAPTPTPTDKKPLNNETFSKFAAEFKKRTKADILSGQIQWGDKDVSSQIRILSEIDNWGKQRAETLAYTGDIAEGDQRAHLQRLGNIQANAKNWYRDANDLQKALDEEKERYEKTRVRRKDENTFFTDDELKKYVTAGLNPRQIAFNKAQEKLQSDMQRLGEMWRASTLKTPYSINKEAEAAKQSAEAAGRGLEWTRKMYEAIEARQKHELEKLDARRSTAFGNILENLAKAQVSPYAKIETQRQAELKKYYGTDDYAYAKANKDNEQIKMAEDAINKKYAKERMDQIVKDAKKEIEFLEKHNTERTKIILEGLKGVYERGGKTIEGYYGEKLKAESSTQALNAANQLEFMELVLKEAKNQQEAQKPRIQIPDNLEFLVVGGQTIEYSINAINKSSTSPEDIKTFKDKVIALTSTVKSLDEFISKINKLEPDRNGIKLDIYTQGQTSGLDIKYNEQAFKNLIATLKNPNTSPENALKTITEALALATDLAKTVGPDIEELNDMISKLEHAKNSIKGKIQENKIKSEEDQRKFTATVNALQKESADIRNKIYSQHMMTDPLVFKNASLEKGVTFGRSTSPYAPYGFDADRLAYEEKVKRLNAESISRLGKVSKLPGGDMFNPQQIDESNEDFLIRARKEFATKLADAEFKPTQEGLIKIRELKDSFALLDQQRNDLLVQFEESTAKKRINVAQGMAGMIGQTAEMLYEASGKQSKEAFYVMKAMAFAEASVKGLQTIMSAYAAGMSVGGPAAPAIAAAYGAIASAFVGTQLGLIAASAVAGPTGKAEGGPIKGGSGTKDDVPIMAMGGEFVIKKSSAQKYGTSFLDALNRGLIPVNDLNFSIPSPATVDYKTHYAEGGLIASNQKHETRDKDQQNLQIVNVIDPALLDKYLASNAGQKTLVNVLAANRYELQQIMR